jgi:hypothetical protein
MKNSATDNGKCNAIVFYQPNEDEKFTFYLYNSLGVKPLRFGSDPMNIAFKIEETGQVVRHKLQGKQQFVLSGFGDKDLQNALSNGHIIKVAIVDGTSRWNFTISGRMFPN